LQGVSFPTNPDLNLTNERRLAFHLSSDTPKSELLLAKREDDSSTEPEIVLSVI